MSNIDYSINNGADWTSLDVGTANDGIYTWTIPNEISDSCLVRVH